MQCLAVVLFSVATVSCAIADPGDAERPGNACPCCPWSIEQDEGIAMQKFSAGTDGTGMEYLPVLFPSLRWRVVMTGRLSVRI